MPERDEIETLIEDARHEEIIAQLELLVAATKKETGKEAALAKLLDQKSELFAVLLDKWKEAVAPNIPAPNVIVQANQDKVIQAVENSAKELKAQNGRVIELLEQLIVIRGADVDFVIKRDYGLIEKVTAKVIMPKQKFNA